MNFIGEWRNLMRCMDLIEVIHLLLILQRVDSMNPKVGNIVKLINNKHGEIFIVKIIEVYSNGDFDLEILKIIKPKGYIGKVGDDIGSINGDVFVNLTQKEADDLMVDLL